MKLRLLKQVTALAVIALLASCGGGGGGSVGIGFGPSGGAADSAPLISASLISFQSGSDPGFTSNAAVTVKNGSADIATAIVTINDVTLTYNPDSGHKAYEGHVSVAPGENIVLNVTDRGKTYTASAAQFTSYPAISLPGGGSWYTGIPNVVLWSSGAPLAGAVYNIGILDANNPSELIWPTDTNNYFKVLENYYSGYPIPENSVSAGERSIIVGLVTGVSIPDAAYGSDLLIGGFTSAPLAVVDGTLKSIAITPRDPSVPGGIPQQFTATGTFSDDNTVDLTAQVYWDTDRSVAWMSGTVPGLATTSGYLGKATVSAGLAGISDSTVLTVTPATMVSLGVYATPAAAAVNTTKQLMALGKYTDNSLHDLTSVAAWTSSDPDIATISNQTGSNGLATGVAGGTATITAEYNGMSGSLDLTVPEWTLQPVTMYAGRVIWGDNMFLAAGGWDLVHTSPDGVTWTSHGSRVEDSSLLDIAWSGTQYVAVGSPGMYWTKGTPAYTSPDGIAWTKQSLGIYEPLSGVTWGGSSFVAVGFGRILTSPDGAIWTVRSGANGDIRDVVWSGSGYVAVGSWDTMFCSPDAATWSSYPRPHNDMKAIAWSGSLFATVGWGGIILTSPDGMEWTAQISGTHSDLKDIIWTGSKFITVGSSGTVLTSTDGITWTTEVTGFTTNLVSVAWSGSNLVSLGENGVVFTSP